MTLDGPASQRWRELLAARAIPPEILAAAPGTPHGHDPAAFVAPESPADTPSRRAALALLGIGGTVLDVGCGGGRAGLALAGPTLTHLTGLDPAADMLAEFGAACERRGVPHTAVHSPWPTAEGSAPTADVVVCHHVGYNTPDLAAFVLALGAAARRGVVFELHDEHPMAWLDPLWEHFHGLRRPAPPTADDAIAVLREVGIDPRVHRWTRPVRDRGGDEPARFATRRLCLPEERRPEVAAAIADLSPRERVLRTCEWRMNL